MNPAATLQSCGLGRLPLSCHSNELIGRGRPSSYDRSLVTGESGVGLVRRNQGPSRRSPKDSLEEVGPKGESGAPSDCVGGSGGLTELTVGGNGLKKAGTRPHPHCHLGPGKKAEGTLRHRQLFWSWQLIPFDSMGDGGICIS